MATATSWFLPLAGRLALGRDGRFSAGRGSLESQSKFASGSP